jgi:hypothetical protein
MMKILTAHTSETDDVEAAVREILEQLDLNRLRRYSAGIMYYHSDFAQTGVTKRLCEKLPFPVMGGTTSNSAVPGSKEDINLTLTVFTSDTVAFTAGVSDPVDGEPFVPLEKLYRELHAGKPETAGEKPSMFFIVVPKSYDIPGDEYLAVLNGLSGGVPVFGSVAFTHTADFTDIKTFFNGAEYDKSLVVLAFWGSVEPKFFISDIPQEQIIHQRAVITDSYKNRIKKVNGIPVLKYLESIGLAKNGELEQSGIGAFPLVLHAPGGSRLIRSMYISQGGDLLCSGVVPFGYPMEISFCDKEFVMKSARKTADECGKWLASQDNTRPRAALVISCAARRWTLGTDVFAEIREIDESLQGVPYHFSYSRGEFCPVSVSRGTADNYFFNFSLCICII